MKNLNFNSFEFKQTKVFKKALSKQNLKINHKNEAIKKVKRPCSTENVKNLFHFQKSPIIIEKGQDWLIVKKKFIACKTKKKENVTPN